jgi:hypothetical protein
MDNHENLNLEQVSGEDAIQGNVLKSESEQPNVADSNLDQIDENQLENEAKVDVSTETTNEVLSVNNETEDLKSDSDKDVSTDSVSNLAIENEPELAIEDLTTNQNKADETGSKDSVSRVPERDKAASGLAENLNDELLLNDPLPLPEDDESEVLDESDDEDVSENGADRVVDYSSFSKEQLLVALKDLIHEKPVNLIKRDVEEIKKNYYKLRKIEVDEIKKKFIADGEDAINFEVPKDVDEDYLKELFEDYRKRKAEFHEAEEQHRRDNLELKKEIIDKIGVLANGEESLDNTFSEFKELQRKWNEIGPVPHTESKDMWSSFNLQVERFYDYIKINNELRDLDFRKNLEFKIALCEKAESLLLESNVVNAYKTLQKYHEKWREYGPVPHKDREEIWERFQSITREINKKHQEHFLQIKEEREMNLRKKQVLCEQTEELLKAERKSINEWSESTQQIVDFQAMWKSIGMVPSHLNAPVYERFRSACNKFFEEKKEYFQKIREEQNNNLQLKIDLCVQAESMQNSTDWKKTTDAMLQLQKRWKTIGQVPRKQSDVVWKRFRSACNKFFEAKSAFFNDRDQSLKDNLEKKLKLVAEVKAYIPAADHSNNVAKIKEFQNRWTEIGFVPFREKDKLQKDYRNAIDSLYEKLNLSKDDVDMSKYRERMELYAGTSELDKLRKERSYIIQKMKTIESEITLWENNLSFFSGSAGDLLKDVNKKLDSARTELESLAEKKKIIDLTERALKKNEKDSTNEK